MSFLSIRQQAMQFDWALAGLAVALVAVSLTAIYSMDLSRGEKLNFFFTQSSAAAIGAGFFLGASALHVSFYRNAAKLIYLLAALLLFAVLFFGKTIHGTTGWFHLAGLSFQPAEFAKVSLVLFLAAWVERFGRRFYKWQFIFTSGLITLVLAGLILFQPDVGSALVLVAILFGFLLLTGIKKRYLWGLMAVGLMAASVAWFFFLASYQKERVLTFIEPGRDPLGAGYNVTQSIIAIGSGKLFGRGLGFGSQSQLHFLPEAQTDFIFAVIAEELGLVGATVVLALYTLLFWRLLILIKKARDDFSAYVVAGALLLFFIQIVINLGAVMGFLPVIGVTLPFLSYGGSSLLINLLLLGIVESVARSGVKGEASTEIT